VEGQINKNTPPEDIRKVIATEIQQQVMVPGGANPLTRFLWPDSTMPAYQVTYTSVPAGLREPIRQALQGKGLMSDDAAVANIYREVFNTNNLAIIDAAIKKAGLPVTDANRLRVYFLEREKKK